MLWIDQLYISIILLSGIFTATLSAYAYRHRSASGASVFAGFMAFVTFWSFITIMRLINTNPAWDVIWFNLRYFFLATTPVLWLIFALEYAGWQQWLSRLRITGLFLIPAVTQIMVWRHGIIGNKFGYVASHWYGVHTVYSYLLVGLSLAVLIASWMRSSLFQKRQILLLILGILLPVATTALYTVQILRFGAHDLNSLALTGTGMCFAWALYRYQLFDLTPIARTVLVDSMDDPMLVLDRQKRILDMNWAAERLIGQARTDMLGQPASQVLAPWPGLLRLLEDQLEARAEMSIEHQGQSIAYDLRISPLYDHRRRLSGRLVVLRDITPRKQAEESLRESQRQLKASYQREQERRHLSETLREAVMIVGSTLEPQRVVGLLLDELQKVVTYHFASVMLVSEHGLTRLVRRNARGESYTPMTFPIEMYPLNAEVLQEKRPIVIADVSQDPRWKESSETGDVRSLLNTPLLVQDRPIGVLCIGRGDALAYTDEEANIVFAFATQVAMTVENARLAEQTRLALIDLQNTLERLQRTQKRLIESEKMAALGQLVANVAHEINTPIGAIRASASNIATALRETLDNFPALFQQLTPAEQTLFFRLILRALQEKQALTSAEERRRRRGLRQILAEAQIPAPDDVADTLVDMGIYDTPDAFLPLLRHPQHSTLLRSAYNLTGQYHHTQNIQLAVDRAAKVVSALKFYAHFEQSSQKTEARLTDGIEVALTLYYNQLKHGIEVVKQYADIPLITCYPDDLTQVWTNLIHNAIWAMQGQGRLEISVTHPPTPSLSQREGETHLSPSLSQREGAGGEFLLVEITDSGCGIPPEIEGRIFEPFFTTKPAGEGSGLGLDICKKIIDKHQGRIAFESQPGRTTFRVWLPVS